MPTKKKVIVRGRVPDTRQAQAAPPKKKKATAKRAKRGTLAEAIRHRKNLPLKY